MKNFKKLILLVIVMSLTVFMASCGDKSGAEKLNAPIYKVAMEPTFPPFDTIDKEDPNKLAGLDVDLMEAIAKDQGFELEWVNMGFAGLIPALEAGNIDIIASGMNASDERKEKINFSTTYYDSGLVVAVKDGNDQIKGLDDLTKEMKAGGQIGTTGGDLCQQLQSEGKIKEAKIYDGLDVAVADLVSGNIDVLINDLPVTKAYMEAMPNKIMIVGETLNAESFGFGVSKNNEELLAKINQGLENLKNSGELDKIYDKWLK